MLNKNDSVEKRLQVLLRRYNDGEWEEVVKEATKLIKKFPSVLDTYNLLGATFHKLENFSGSLESYKVGLIIQPKQRDVYNNLGNTLISMSKDKHALCSFQKATILDPKFAQGFFNIGICKNRRSVKGYHKGQFITRFRINHFLFF